MANCSHGTHHYRRSCVRCHCWRLDDCAANRTLGRPPRANYQVLTHEADQAWAASQAVSQSGSVLLQKSRVAQRTNARDSRTRFDCRGSAVIADETCPVCGKPRRSDYASCGSRYCMGLARFCNRCGVAYRKSGGGYKYCSPECRALAGVPRTTVKTTHRPRPAGEQPPCGLCGERPQHWRPTSGTYLPYCGPSGCANPERKCLNCGERFNRLLADRTKYCSAECAAEGKRNKALEDTCALCGRRGHRYGVGPYVCAPCREPIRRVHGRLSAHNVPVHMWQTLIDDPTCRICGVDIMKSVPDGSGRWRVPLVVDHDHSCCPGATSCGRCVRGFLCPGCNTALGMMGDDSARLLAAARYLNDFCLPS